MEFKVLTAKQAVSLWFEGVELEKRASTELAYTPFDLTGVCCAEIREWALGIERKCAEGYIDISEYRVKPTSIS